MGSVHFLLRSKDESNMTDTTTTYIGDGAHERHPTSAISRPIVRTLADVPAREVQWMWPGRFPLGKVTLIAGDPGLGKSFLTLDMASRLSRGADWPDAAYPNRLPGSTLLISAEDDPADTIRPRLDAMGADTSKIRVLDGVFWTNAKAADPLRLDRDVSSIDKALETMEMPRLVVIDPISAYLGSVDNNSNADVRVVLAMLGALAEKHRVAIVCVTHLNKGGTGKAVYRAMGSLAFVAAARVAHIVTKHPGDERLRLLLPVKMNIDATRTGLGFRVEQGRVAWAEGQAALTADDLESEGSQETATQLSDAMELIAIRLKDGPVPAAEINREGEEMGISSTTLGRARKRMGVKTTRQNSVFMWSLGE